MDTFTLDKIEFDAVRRILASFCACSPGKALARRIGPSRNPQTITRWLDETTQMVAAVRDVGPPPFGGITDISDAVGRAEPGGGAGAEDYAQIAATLDAAGRLRAYLVALPEKLDLLVALAGEITPFDAEVDAIRAIIDSDGTVRDDASRRLGDLRREIAETARKIHDVIYGYLQKPEVTRLLQHAQVTLHGDRYVLPVGPRRAIRPLCLQPGRRPALRRYDRADSECRRVRHRRSRPVAPAAAPAPEHA